MSFYIQTLSFWAQILQTVHCIIQCLSAFKEYKLHCSPGWKFQAFAHTSADFISWPKCFTTEILNREEKCTHIFYKLKLPKNKSTLTNTLTWHTTILVICCLIRMCFWSVWEPRDIWILENAEHVEKGLKEPKCIPACNICQIWTI